MPFGASRLAYLAKAIIAAAAGRDPVTLNVVGDVQVDTSRSVFGGGSALFDGSGDGLNVTADTGSPFYLIEGDWTVECWFNMDADTGSSTVGLVIVGSHPSSPDYGGGLLVRNFDMKVQTSWDAYNGSDPKQDLTFFGGTAITPDTWNHLAMTYDSTASTWNTFLNGSRINSQSVTYSGVKLGNNGAMYIGSGVNSFNAGGNGWIDEVRISNTVRYSGTTYTVPTNAFTNDENTLCLFHMDGTDGSTTFEDDTGARETIGVSAFGNAQVDTAQSKFGGASAKFDGSGDYLITGESDALEIAGDYTIEGWVRSTNVANTQYIINNRSVSSAGLGQFNVRFFNSNIYFSTNSSFANTSVSSNTWYHFAMVRSGSTLTAYLNGNSVGSTTNTTTLGSTNDNKIMIGAYNQPAQTFLSGHVDEVRISSTARYTSNFTPPTEAFENDTDTVLLLHMDGDDASTEFTDDSA